MTYLDYQDLFDSCAVTTEPMRVLEIKRAIKVMLDNQTIYWGVEQATNVPWFVIAAIHFRESSQSFKCHLHNGDPLTAKTIHVPKDRPEQGNPPFTWSASAIDALSDRPPPFAWDIGGALEFCEKYNGLGYQKHGVCSPYVWSFTDKYSGGLFTADGALDLSKKDPRPGVAVLFKELLRLGVSLDFKTGSESSATLH